MNDVERIVEKARELREAHGLSFGKASARIGCTKSHLWAFEKGLTCNPTIKMLRGIADAYGVSLIYLLDDEITAPRLHPEDMRIDVEVHAMRRKK